MLLKTLGLELGLKDLKVTLMKQQVMAPYAMEIGLLGIWIAHPTLQTN